MLFKIDNPLSLPTDERIAYLGLFKAAVLEVDDWQAGQIMQEDDTGEMMIAAILRDGSAAQFALVDSKLTRVSRCETCKQWTPSEQLANLGWLHSGWFCNDCFWHAKREARDIAETKVELQSHFNSSRGC